MDQEHEGQFELAGAFFAALLVLFCVGFAWFYLAATEHNRIEIQKPEAVEADG